MNCLNCIYLTEHNQVYGVQAARGPPGFTPGTHTTEGPGEPGFTRHQFVWSTVHCQLYILHRKLLGAVSSTVSPSVGKPKRAITLLIFTFLLIY